MTADMDDVLLIHGGLWEDVGADWFWRRTGVVDGLAGRGLTVVAPDRLRRAVHPRSAVDALLRLLPSAVELPGCPEPRIVVLESGSWPSAWWWHRISSRAACPPPT
jgi:hypothetical protein